MPASARADRPAARLLAAELRGYRVARDLTGERAALTLRCSPSKISRFENARFIPDENELDRLLKLYRVPADEHAHLRGLRHEALIEAPDHEIAAEVLIWATGTIPPPLRTEAYARAVLAAGRRVLRLTPLQVKAEIVTIRAWQARLRGEPAEPGGPRPAPLRLTCILDEAVLTRRRGTDEVMAGQLDHLASLSAAADIRVLPFDADGPPFGPWTLLGFGDALTDIVQVDGPGEPLRILDGDAVTGYRFAFEELEMAAADTEASAAIIKLAAGRWS
jgi:transcriptional regulator with XRE-family HTH domain